MCAVIITKDNKEIETVKQFHKYFNIDLSEYLETYYKRLDIGSCLCQINLEALFDKHPEIKEKIKRII